MRIAVLSLLVVVGCQQQVRQEKPEPIERVVLVQGIVSHGGHQGTSAWAVVDDGGVRKEIRISGTGETPLAGERWKVAVLVCKYTDDSTYLSGRFVEKQP